MKVFLLLLLVYITSFIIFPPFESVLRTFLRLIMNINNELRGVLVMHSLLGDHSWARRR